MGGTPVKKLLNSLYITQADMTIGRDGTNLVVFQESEKVGQFPVQYFENIICFNYTGMSPAAMALCIESGVGITYLRQNGKILARVNGRQTGNVLLRREQFRIADDESRSLAYAKLFVNAKLFNSIKVLDRGIRDYPEHPSIDRLSKAKVELLDARKQVETASNLSSLLGIEGDAARTYFREFEILITRSSEHFNFSGRIRRPPTDRVNALLSLSYGMVRVLVENALTTVGLDPFVGFYHQDRPGRSSLALDMMEELRAYMADRFVLSIVNKRQIAENDFVQQDSGAMLFSEDGLKKYLDLWNKRLQREVKHPFLEKKINYGLIPFVQAMLLARTIRGDLDPYPPFLMN